MDPFPQSSRRHRGRAVVWDKKFEQRREKAHLAEERKLIPEAQQSLISAFFENERSRLDPLQYSFTALRKYLERANEDDLKRDPTPYAHATPLALLDDRRDSTGRRSSDGVRHSARDWDGYIRYPPPGECGTSDILDAGQLYRKLLESRLTDEANAERRVIYISNLTPMCALAIAATSSSTQRPVIRDFLQRYISYRVYFGVSNPRSFVIEFHLPYYALRSSTARLKDPRRLRRCGKFIPSRDAPGALEYLYEAQISFLIIGVDEWYWTAYCLADTYFGSEETIQSYNDRQLDGFTTQSREFPVWNPRQYALLVMSRRMKQVAKEWTNVINTLETRLEYHEESIFNELNEEPAFEDDKSFSRTKDYTSRVQLLRLLYNALVKTVESWESFEAGEIRFFDLPNDGILQALWNSYLADMEKDMTELRFLCRSVQQRIEMFDNMRNGLVNASALVESRMATDQNQNIGELTKVTVDQNHSIGRLTKVAVVSNSSYQH
ncbi:hypothetical protein LPUS_11624 [Lasallia pustulata]|uniref:Uncharacterized protein n=1 Tax=Lasallia pustulata TaxID=136370 RepID=A0A1W5DCN7_9LECA|nr:hypothetical protein LPUS_11624 [Lasallia pustulata]